MSLENAQLLIIVLHGFLQLARRSHRVATHATDVSVTHDEIN
ncbi:hypothetical protein [Pantoea ananatis]|nr:hypothetical protein [Pantoea ananatis]MDI6535513.1 hypothetical protein [Pantoea ananatis]